MVDRENGWQGRGHSSGLAGPGFGRSSLVTAAGEKAEDTAWTLGEDGGGGLICVCITAENTHRLSPTR